MMNQIYSVNLYDDRNFMSYSDTDAQTDYFHNRTAGTAHAIEILKEDAGSVLHVSIVNNYTDAKFVKRINRIAKALNYKIKVVEKKGVYRMSEGHDYDTKAPCFFIRPYQYNEYYLFDASLVKESEIITN